MLPKIFVAGHKSMVGSAILRQIKKNKADVIVRTKKQLDLTNEKKYSNFLRLTNWIKYTCVQQR